MMIKVYDDSATPERVLASLAEALERGELLIIPTDTRYSLCGDALNQSSVKRLAQIKGVDVEHTTFSLLLSNLSQVSEYARMDDSAFRLMRTNCPGPFTFILPAGRNLPRLYRGRKEVGVRIPRNRFVTELIDYFGRPLTGFSLPMEQAGLDDVAYGYDPSLMEEQWGNEVAYVVDGGIGQLVDSTMVSCLQEPFEVIREGVEVLK